MVSLQMKTGEKGERFRESSKHKKNLKTKILF